MRIVFHLILSISAVVFATLSGVVPESCDQIELNHKFDVNGKLCFDQLIFWRWYSDDSVYHVREWRMFDESTRLTRRRGLSEAVWMSSDGQSHSVVSTLFKESWTKNDPERDDIKLLPDSERIRLAGRMTKRHHETLPPVLPEVEVEQ